MEKVKELVGRMLNAAPSIHHNAQTLLQLAEELKIQIDTISPALLQCLLGQVRAWDRKDALSLLLNSNIPEGPLQEMQWQGIIYLINCRVQDKTLKVALRTYEEGEDNIDVTKVDPTDLEYVFRANAPFRTTPVFGLDGVLIGFY